MPNNRFMKCLDCEFTYYHNTAAAVAGILVCGNEVLLNVRQKEPGKDKWDLVGGFVDYEETLEQALSRETDEELGIKVENWIYLCSFPNTYTYRNVTYHTMDAVFFSELRQKPKLHLQTSEVSKATWVTLDKVPLSGFAFGSLSKAMTFFIDQKLKSL